MVRMKERLCRQFGVILIILAILFFKKGLFFQVQFNTAKQY
jgi:hypothetical protein